MINKNYTYAVVGASENKEKYGFKVFKDLIDAGYHVFAINPRGGDVLGHRVFPTVAAAPGPINVAIFVVPPQVTMEVLPQLVQRGITKAWFQPGSESDAAIDFCAKNGIEYSANACIMVEKNKATA